MNLAIIIPALNEEQALPLVLKDLHEVLRALSHRISYQVIVSDNGSTDRTAECARSGGARVVQARRRGYGAACLAALAVVPGSTEVVVFMDGDYSIFASDLPALLHPLSEGEADLVLGARVPIDDGALTRPQRFGNALACRLMGWIYGHRYKDLGPFRAIRWEVLKTLRMRDQAFGWTIEMQIKALRHDLHIQEVPVRYRNRIGTSKISGTFTGSIQAGGAILWTVLKYAWS